MSELICDDMWSRLIGQQPHPDIISGLASGEDGPAQQLIVDGAHSLLGPGGTRALATAMLGTGKGMKGPPYKLLKSLRLWAVNTGDDGAAAMVSIAMYGINA